MASQKQIEANRKNAQKSTGAKTPEGKAIVRLNAVTHGVTAEAAVIPFVENPEDWEAHRQGIIESLSPVGHLETVLAERIAMLIWRLGRANRCERELVALEQERMEEKHFEYNNEYKSLKAISYQIGEYKRLRNLFVRLPRMQGDQSIQNYDAIALFDAAAEVAENTNTDDLDIPGFPEDETLEDFDGWTADILRGALQAMADSEETTYDDMFDATRLRLAFKEAKAKLELEKAATEIERKRRKKLLPDTPILDKLYRYESHLERSLYKAMREIERVQAIRKGQPVTQPVEVEVTVNAP